MFLILFGLATSAETLSHVRSLVENEKYGPAYKAATNLIEQDGIFDVNPIVFNIRGTCAFRIGKYKDAIADLTRFISLPEIAPFDRETAYFYRAQANLHLGNIDDATNDAEKCKRPQLKKDINSAVFLADAAAKSMNEKEFKVALAQYEKLLKISSASPTFLINAAECAFNLGNMTLFDAYSKQASNIDPKNVNNTILNGKAFFANSQLKQAINNFKKCSEGSRAKDCIKLYKDVKSFENNMDKAETAIKAKKFDEAGSAIKVAKSIADNIAPEGAKVHTTIDRLEVKVLVANGDSAKALELLNGLLENSQAIDLLLDRADILLAEDDFDGAISDYQAVLDKQKNNKRAQAGLKKASDKREKDKHFDYYEVLGLKKGCTEKEIKDAYRKAVVKWHPDRYTDPLKKKEAEKMMKRVNMAMDVLGDKKKRQMYDAGYDPESGAPPPGDDRQQTINFGDFGGGFTGFNGFGRDVGLDDILRMFGGGMGGGGQQFVYMNGQRMGGPGQGQRKKTQRKKSQSQRRN